MIQTIQGILINGKNSLFGGYIYNAKYNVSYGEGQSTVKLSLISESGQYQTNIETLKDAFCHPYSIQIGNQINLDLYLTKINKTVSPAGNTLELSFTDGSFRLDQINVGLYKRQGLQTNGDMIIVGWEIDPCNPENLPNPINHFYDVCSPCINNLQQQALSNYIDCEFKANFEIRDVKYNFTSLLAQIPFPVVNAIDPNPLYLERYTGSLRNVLNQWCQAFGWFFYWENGSIVFQDLRNVIQITANIEQFCPNLTEYNEEFSMENSFKTVSISNFTRAGDIKDYLCQSAEYLTAQPLVQGVGYTNMLTLTSAIDRYAAGFCTYSPILRDLYHWYINHEMWQIDATHYYPGQRLEEFGMTILSTPITLVIGGDVDVQNDAYLENSPPAAFLNAQSNGSLKSLSPFDGTAAAYQTPTQQAAIIAIQANNTFYQCFQLIDITTQWKMLDNINSYFFFLAEYNQDIENKKIEDEKGFAGIWNKYAAYVFNNDPFMQQYDFELDNLCGYQYFINTGNISYKFLGDHTGGVTLYNTSYNKGPQSFIGDLPFSKYLSIVYDQAGYPQTQPARVTIQMILVERSDAGYFPTQSTHNDTSFSAINNYDTINKASAYRPYRIAQHNTSNGELISTLLTQLGVADDTLSNPNMVSLFVGTNPGEQAFYFTTVNGYSPITNSGTVFDGKPLNKQIDPTMQKEEIIYQYPDLKCRVVGNFGGGYYSPMPVINAETEALLVSMKTPVGTFKYYEPTNTPFGIVIEKSVQSKRIVQKVESFYNTNEGGDNCNYAKLIVNPQNISDDRLSILTRQNSVCQYDPASIQQIHEEFSKNLGCDYTQPTIAKTFKIVGLDCPNYAPTIANGLISLNIDIGDKGITSSYEFGTRLMKLPAIETLIFPKLLNTTLNPGTFTNTANYYPLVNQQSV